jgi:hypothetical protein
MQGDENANALRQSLPVKPENRLRIRFSTIRSSFLAANSANFSNLVKTAKKRR